MPLIVSLLAATVLAASVAAALVTGRGVLPPRMLCQACVDQSARHPSGPLHRYTRRRDHHGRPRCHRHQKDKV